MSCAFESSTKKYYRGGTEAGSGGAPRHLASAPACFTERVESPRGTNRQHDHEQQNKHDNTATLLAEELPWPCRPAPSRDAQPRRVPRRSMCTAGAGAASVPRCLVLDREVFELAHHVFDSSGSVDSPLVSQPVSSTRRQGPDRPVARHCYNSRSRAISTNRAVAIPSVDFVFLSCRWFLTRLRVISSS